MKPSKPVAKAFAPCRDPNGIPNDKTGNLFTAVMHIFCAIVGAGVLALPSTVAWLGWVAGPIMLIVFYVISLISSNMLADVYCVDNTEFARYHHAVRYTLGRFNAVLLSIAQLSNLFLITIAYTITGGLAMKTIAQRSCDIQGIAQADCWSTTWKLTLLFGAAQCLLSQVKNLESAWWVSSIGVATSLTYSTIALVLGCVYSGAHAGSVGGISANTPNKAFGVLNALGGIAFAYSFSLILLEIQDTLRQPPSTTKTMKRAVNIGVTASFIFYFTVAVVGYCALGNDVPSMVLAGFPQAPNWLIMLANVCILVHMLAAFQTYAQPMFDTFESWLKVPILRRQQGAPPQGAIQKAEAAPTVATEEGRVTVTPGEDSAHALARRSVRNTAPVPTLRPSMGYGRTSVASGVRIPEARSPGPGRTSQSSVVSGLERLSMVSAMYHVDTGFTNEAVPLNDEHYFLPLWVRVAVRTLYVIIVTVLSVVMPFFGSIVGLIGAATFLPLAIYFPYLMYTKVHRPRGLVRAYMWVTGIFMGLVCGAATVAAVRGIILSWSTYTIFAD